MNERAFSVQVNQTLRQRLIRIFGLLALFVLLLLTLGTPGSATASGVTTYTGTLPSGAAYKIEVPSAWNGTLLLYSHGFVPPGAPNPATDVGDPTTGAYLLTQGFALAGSSYSQTGWAVQQAFEDQPAVLDLFKTLVGKKPKRTIAWGHSLGGMITAGLVQKFPHRFDGALPMCGLLGGGVGVRNTELDRAFAFVTLLAPNSGLQVVHITNPGANLGLAEQLLAQAQATPQGRARTALVAALGDEPSWFIPFGPPAPPPPEPAPNDYAARQEGMFHWLQIAFVAEFNWQADIEAKAGGNPSWNTGVNYRKQLALSVDRYVVNALYQQAGLDLEQDIQTLQNAHRIAADPGAVKYMSKYVVFNGEISVPVLTMHTTDDGLVPVENEQAYASVVREEGNNRLLRQVYVHRPGHCNFTPAETVTALQTLIARLDTDRWPNINAGILNNRATGLGASLNTFVPSFIEFEPAQFLRPFDLGHEQEKSNALDRRGQFLPEAVSFFRWFGVAIPSPRYN